MTDLTTLLADLGCTRRPKDIYVMCHKGRSGRCVGQAGRVFRADLDRIQVGASQGADTQRGAYDWWALYIDGAIVGELRDDASGYTIHLSQTTKEGRIVWRKRALSRRRST